MPQETYVVKLAPAEQAALEARLQDGDFEHKSVAHARFSVRGEGVIATLYRSGKLVVQGEEPSLFAARYLDREARAEAPRAATLGGFAAGRTLVGSDEAGKGDYFGPLVVAALRADPDQRAELRKAGVADSKTLSDEAVRRMAGALRGRYEHAIEVLDPEDYNAEHARVRNLNPMLAELHARAIRRLAEPKCAVLVDRFANERLIAERVSDLELDLVQEPRAEREETVAAASIVARAVFLERLAELSEEFAVDLHKGAGAPTDAAARRFLELHGFDALGRVAKMHFKNTKKLLPEGRRG